MSAGSQKGLVSSHAVVKFAVCAFLVLLSAGCEKSEQSRTEIKAKHKFESISNGSHRKDLRKTLGPPSGIVYEAGKSKVLYSRRKTREIVSIELAERKTWTTELKVFSKCALRAPADYFSDGKIKVLFVFDKNESVVCKEVHVS
jgi:hypothetical protein